VRDGVKLEISTTKEHKYGYLKKKNINMEALHISRFKRARNYVAKKEDHKQHDQTDNPNPCIPPSS
jgi:hypothetical protein